MSARERFDWDEEDELFEAEFLDISTLHQQSQSNPPKVPSRLSRLIRQQAKANPTDDLTKNWLFSKAMLLVLAILILFSVGLVFSFAVGSRSDQNAHFENKKSELHLRQ